MITSPPLPPSPPDGPPRGTNFSRRNAMQPFPPSPAFTRILASSMNIAKSKSLDPKPRLVWRGSCGKIVWRGYSCPRDFPTACLLRFYGLNHHELAHRSLVHKLDAARD